MPTEELFLSVTNKQTNCDRTPGHSATDSQMLVAYTTWINQQSQSEKQEKQVCFNHKCQGGLGRALPTTFVPLLLILQF